MLNGLITSKYKHMLWKDELNDSFLLTKYCEVYQLDENTLRLMIFFKKKASQLRKKGLILNENSTDDGLTIWDVSKRFLPLIIQLGAFKRRPNINGKWVKDKEKRLGHKIIPFNPILNKQ